MKYFSPKFKIYSIIVLIFSSLILSNCTEVPLSNENKILSFTLTRGGFSKSFEIIENSIIGTVDSTIDLNGLSLNIPVSKGATISPDPSKITTITGDFSFTVTAENGDIQLYNISIKRLLSTENSILGLTINAGSLLINPQINTQNYTISQRVPSFLDLTNLNVSVRYSDRATISPDPNNVKDYSSPVKYTVTSETGDKKEYIVTLTSMLENFSESCMTTMNANKWFGGDNRTNAPDILPNDRVVGTGQAVKFSTDVNPLRFTVLMDSGFKYFNSQTNYNQNVQLKLNIRETNGKIIASTNTTVLDTFNGGAIAFNIESLHLLFKKETTYIFQWYLVDGIALGVNTGSYGNTNSGTGFCFSGGYSGEASRSKGTSLEDSTVWYSHPWNFNIEISGKK